MEVAVHASLPEALVMLLFALVSYLLLRREGLLRKKGRHLIAVAALILAFSLRFLMLDHVTLDYQDFLSRWVDFFRKNGGFRALRYSVGNYNVPYLHFLALFSYIPYPDLYLIKYLSVAFDVVLAWGCMKLVGCVTRSRGRELCAFLGTLLLPTVLLNGAYWGQCDAVYVAFAVLSLWAAFDRRPRLSLVFITCSFAFKLQAVFFMPLYFILLVNREIRWRHIWVVPVTYTAIVLPSLLAGRPFIETLTLYLDQTGSIGSGLNYNSPSIFAFYRSGDQQHLATLSILAAFFFCFVLLFILGTMRQHPGRELMLAAFTLCVICVPLLLPHMHDRYFFGADILSFAAAFLSPVLLPLPLLCSFASLLGYHAYLKMRYLLPMRCGTVALIAGALLLIFYMAAVLPRQKSREISGRK